MSVPHNEPTFWIANVKIDYWHCTFYAHMSMPHTHTPIVHHRWRSLFAQGHFDMRTFRLGDGRLCLPSRSRRSHFPGVQKSQVFRTVTHNNPLRVGARRAVALAITFGHLAHVSWSSHVGTNTKWQGTKTKSDELRDVFKKKLCRAEGSRVGSFIGSTRSQVVL